MTPHPFLRASVLLYGGMSAVALLWGWLADRPLLLLHPEPWWQLEPLFQHAASVAGGLGLGLVTVLFSQLAARRFSWARELHAGFRGLLGEVSAPVILGLALTSGIGEELFFRGAMQPTLGWVITSIVFGVIHIGPDRRFLAWTPFAIAAGFAFGALHEATGSLAGPIVAHVLINYLNLRFIVRTDLGPPA
ncbi:MAG: lysostaphin resistance A-like protein [Sandaracinaceae bacterium]